jgi:hypothetical protein
MAMDGSAPAKGGVDLSPTKRRSPLHLEASGSSVPHREGNLPFPNAAMRLQASADAGNANRVRSLARRLLAAGPTGSVGEVVFETWRQSPSARRLRWRPALPPGFKHREAVGQDYPSRFPAEDVSCIDGDQLAPPDPCPDLVSRNAITAGHFADSQPPARRVWIRHKGYLYRIGREAPLGSSPGPGIVNAVCGQLRDDPGADKGRPPTHHPDVYVELAVACCSSSPMGRRGRRPTPVPPRGATLPVSSRKTSGQRFQCGSRPALARLRGEQTSGIRATLATEPLGFLAILHRQEDGKRGWQYRSCRVVQQIAGK